MVTRLELGFNTAQIGTMSCVISGAIGSGTATVTAGTYGHSTFASLSDPGASGYTAFSTAVAAALQAAVNAGTWVVTYTAPTTQTPSTGIYVITNASSTYTLTWTGTGGTNLKHALGFSASSNASDANGVVQSAVCPYYLIVPAIAGRSKFFHPREPSGTEISAETSSDGGTDRVVSMSSTQRRADWQHACEPLASVWTDSVAASRPWAWEDFFVYARGEHPIKVVDGSSTTYHRLRADGSAASDEVIQRVVADWDGLWAVNLKTRKLT